MRFAAFCCLSFCFSVLQGQIIELDHFDDLPSYVTKDTLIILDIDDTLLIPVQMLGCDEWFTHQFQKYIQEGMDHAKALEKSLTEWEAIRHLTQMEIVESGSEKIIQTLQEEGFSVMGLTTQELVLSARTRDHLLEQKIDLSKTAPSQRDHYFQMGDYGVLYRKGVLFTSGRHKGEALFYLCDMMDHDPKRIVFVNDKATHLAEIEVSAEKRGIEFVGLRYSYSDSRKKAFQPEIAEYQFLNSSLGYLLSDQEVAERGF